MKLLLFGINGQVGWELNRSLLPLGDVIAVGRELVDFTDNNSLRRFVREIKPEVIVNAAAYTSVDKAEEEEGLAVLVNGVAPRVLAEEVADSGSLLVHYSTDYVFDGAKDCPYVETDKPNPINAYGRSKLVGEEAIHASGCNYLIFRTAWVYSKRGHNFLLSMLRLANERDELCVVDDQWGAPTWARQIADITSHIVKISSDQLLKKEFSSGLYHLSSTGKTSWYGFARQIVQYAQEAGLVDKSGGKLNAISSEQYLTQARRPNNSSLETRNLERKYNLIMPAWERALKLCIQDLQS